MSKSLTLGLQPEGRRENAAKEKICPIYKMMYSFPKPVMEVEMDSLLLKHNRTGHHQVG